MVANWVATQPELMSFLSIAYQSSMQISVISLFLIDSYLPPVCDLGRSCVIEEEVMLQIKPVMKVMSMAVTDLINDLRLGDNPTLNIEGSIGVVGMPSFHTILSALLVLMARGAGWFFIVSLIWNAIIIFAPPLMGNHYVADVLGGLITSVFAIWAAHQFCRLVDAHYERNKRSKILLGFMLPRPRYEKTFA